MSNTTLVEKGHPQGLYWLFAAEMWERFCYYGMRALLLLYLVKSLAMGDNKGFAVYGAYTALVYVMPVIGGRLADRTNGRCVIRFSTSLPNHCANLMRRFREKSNASV